MRRRTQGDESEPLLSSMEQTPPTKEKLDATSDDAVIIPVDDTYAVSAATLLPESCASRQLASVLAHV